MSRTLACALGLLLLLGGAAAIVQPSLARALEEEKKLDEKKAEEKQAGEAGAEEAGKDEAKKDEAKQDEPKKDEAKPTEAKPADAKPEAKAEKPADAGAGLLKILRKAKKEVDAPKEASKVVTEEAKEGPATPAAAAAAPTQPAGAEKKAEAADDKAVEVKIEAAAKAKKKKKEGDKKAEKKDAAKKKAPSEPMFRLRDGTRLAGTPDLQLLGIATAYGKLTVPVPEVIHIRFAALEDQALAARVAEAIRALGDEEFDKREEAMAALREIGAPALPALRKALGDEDEEVKTRAEKLAGEIEETVEEEDESNALSLPLGGEEDEVRTLKFVVRGRVEEESFQLKTRYGALQLAKKDILSIFFRDSPSAKFNVQVAGATFAAANKWVDTKVAFTQGERLRITASGQLNLEQYGQSTGPEGTTNVSSNQLQSFATGALVGKIGDKGQPFLVGSELDGTANASGNLFLGISMQNGQASGQYEVEVEKEGEGS